MDNPKETNKENIKANASLDRVALQLKHRYDDKRDINMLLLAEPAKWLRVIFAIVQIICCIVLVFSSLACIASSNSKMNNLSPNMYGYSCVDITENIGEEDKFSRGDNVIFHSVQTDSLKAGDIIAYYVYGITYYNVNFDALNQVADFSGRNYTFTFASIFGHQSEIITQAARENCVLVVHHIKDVYEDVNGVRYFLTYGANVNVDDRDNSSYLVREDMVVGVYDNGFVARFNTLLLRAMQSPAGMVLLFLPLLLVVAYVIYIYLHDAQLTALHRDVIEEKRPLSDSLCTEHSIGYGMDDLDKYKVLAQFGENITLEHFSLLWQDANSDEKLKEYLVQAKYLLPPIKQMLNVHRSCKQMFDSGEENHKIAEYYLENRQSYEKDLALAQRKFKAFFEKYKQQVIDDEYLQIEKEIEEWLEDIKKQSLHNKKEKLPNAKTESKSNKSKLSDTAKEENGERRNK